MNPTTSPIDLALVQETAEKHHISGFSCSESVFSTMLDIFEPGASPELVRIATGMAAGLGQSGCVCGALNGGVMAIGMLFGRTEPSRDPKDPKKVKSMKLSKELHDWFRENNTKNTACCRILTKEFDMKKGEHKPQCTYYSGICAAKTAEIIARELDIPTTGAITLLTREEYKARKF